MATVNHCNRIKRVIGPTPATRREAEDIRHRIRGSRHACPVKRLASNIIRLQCKVSDGTLPAAFGPVLMGTARAFVDPNTAQATKETIRGLDWAELVLYLTIATKDSVTTPDVMVRDIQEMERLGTWARIATYNPAEKNRKKSRAGS